MSIMKCGTTTQSEIRANSSGQGEMFVKSNREPEQPVNQPQQQAAAASAAAAAAAAVPPKRGLRNGTPSIISADLIVRGALFSAGDVQIDGRVDGDIRAGGLIVGEKAVIVGDVYAEEIVVRGRVRSEERRVGKECGSRWAP